jgi:hypothetical protein
MDDDFWWQKGGTSSGSGMLRHGSRTRTSERRIKEYPDGTRETVETITDKDSTTSYFTVHDPMSFNKGADTFANMQHLDLLPRSFDHDNEQNRTRIANNTKAQQRLNSEQRQAIDEDQVDFAPAGKQNSKRTR